MSADAGHEPNDADADGTRGPEYAHRLQSLETARWKRLVPVQLPYRLNLRRLRLGRTLDVGCGIGRNMAYLDDVVGVDHNATSIEIARSRGHDAYTVEQFLASPHARPGAFDALLLAHVLEHMSEPDGRALLVDYLRYLKPGGRVCLITPQERGFRSDATHIRFVDLDALRELAAGLGLTVERAYSFPLPRFAGEWFTYNEFVLVAAAP